MKKILVAAIVLAAAAAFAAEPAKNVSGKKHPNIAAAQELSHKAFEKLELAQKANEFDMDGHAQKAKDLLDQASLVEEVLRLLGVAVHVELVGLLGQLE